MSLLKPPAFKNWMIDAYLEGRLDEIPAECLDAVKDVAARRNRTEAPAPVPAPEPERKGWDFVGDEDK